MIPLSMQSKLKSVQRRADSAKEYLKSEGNLGDFTVEVSGILTEIRLILDRAYHDIWERHKDEGVGKKPNLFFPIVDTKEKFSARLSKDQLRGLHEKNFKLFNVIEDMQGFSTGRDSNWLMIVQNVAGLKHERDADLEIDHINTSFGVGDNPNGVVIRNLTVGPRGIEVRDEDVVDPLTGERVNAIFDTVPILAVEGTKISPQALLEISLIESRRLVGRIYASM